VTTQPKRTAPRALTTRQKVALPIAAAIWAGLAHEILDTKDGELSQLIKKHAFEFADVFLAE